MMKEECSSCSTRTGVLKCQGCQSLFCSDDYNLHRIELDRQANEITNESNTLQKTSSETSSGLESLLLNQINKWEIESIQKVKEAAEEARRQVQALCFSISQQNVTYTQEIVQELLKSKQNHDFDERHLMKWKTRLNELKLSITKPDISVDEQKSGNPFIMKIFVNEKDRFERTCRPVHIEQDGHLACHDFNLLGSSGEIRGTKEYSIGIHRIRFKIEKLDILPWWFLGITSKSTSMQLDSQNSPSAYG
ncbi:unnamed protein product [Rotaria sp. Silwood1]|nr:unnamed protein product [Rotaria sp. Silwood1]CAF1670665.1 unnamed protein product [Rotaria sp. Silwood1]CAF3962602.1 unnamed protein product [Rotaria sp. Silwood1]CAF5034870.1 unnamed protein product [Rotaria sp. Silwood1]